MLKDCFPTLRARKKRKKDCRKIALERGLPHHDLLRSRSSRQDRGINRTNQTLQQTNKSLAEVGTKVTSNARSIEALSDNLRTYQQEAQIDRARLYQVMADLARNQASHYDRLSIQDEQIQIYSTPGTWISPKCLFRIHPQLCLSHWNKKSR